AALTPGDPRVRVRREEVREPAREEVGLGSAALVGAVLLGHGHQSLDAGGGPVLRAPREEIVLAGPERNLPPGGRGGPEDRTEDPVERGDELRLCPAAHAEETPLAPSGFDGAGQLLEDLHVGAAKVVDGLLPVTHRAEQAGLERESPRAFRARPARCT